MNIERAILDRLIDAWDSTVLPKSRDGMMQERMEDLRAALAAPATATSGRFKIGDHVFKVEGSQWSGRIVGWYSTDLTPIGWAVESFIERDSVQIYPDAALELIDEAAPATVPDRHAQELLAQDITLQNMAERHAQELCAYSVTVDKLRDQLASTPAWHDAPTCAGLWVRRSEYLVDALNLDGAAVSFLRQDKTTKHLMWYGPIPEDKQ